MGKFDLSKLQQLAQEEIDERNSRESTGNGLKMCYIGFNGKFRVKLLFDPKSNLLQRRITRHVVGKDKIPCLSIYGEECPICKAINEAESLYGRDCGAWKSYGAKTRGISHAVIMGHDKKVFTGDKDPSIGDTVLLQYPMSMYNEINNLIVDSGEYLESIVATNQGKTVELERTGGGSLGPMAFKANVYAFGDEKVKATDDEFDDLLNSLPSLNEELVPSQLTSEILEKARAAAETITAEYAGGSVINPNDKPVTPVTPTAQVTPQVSQTVSASGPIAAEPVDTQASTSSGDAPECMGKYDENSTKCLVCPHDVDCITASL